MRRRRYERTCTCAGRRTFTAPPAPKLIPKGRYGISLWVEILLDKYFTYRPTERLLNSWRLLGLDLAPGTITDGLRRLEILLRPIYEAIKRRNPQGDLHQGDETRWQVFVPMEGKEGYGWWLWLVKSLDTVIYHAGGRAVTQSCEKHRGPVASGCWWSIAMRRTRRSTGQGRGDRAGVLLVHVRRDFRRRWVKVGRIEEAWALEWVGRIRELYRLNDRRLEVRDDAAAFATADGAFGAAVTAFGARGEAELAAQDLHPTPRKALESLGKHWTGLTVFVDDPEMPMDNNTAERSERGPVVGRKNYYGRGSLWSGQLMATLFSILARRSACGSSIRGNG